MNPEMNHAITEALAWLGEVDYELRARQGALSAGDIHRARLATAEAIETVQKLRAAVEALDTMEVAA